MNRLKVEEALMTLEKRGPILDIARDVSRLMRESGIEGAVIGGVAVVLHGHVRTTLDVDVWTTDSEALAGVLTANGYEFDPKKKEFVKSGVPVHIVLEQQTGAFPAEFVDVDSIRTVGLADLVQMKLRSGIKHITRAQDLADVIGLIRHHALTGEFAGRIAKELRPEFRKLVKAVQEEPA